MRVAVIFQGRVQGVGFRATARSVARGFVVTGFVRNEPDGSVYLEAQGEQTQVRGFLDRLGDVMAANIRSRQEQSMVETNGETEFGIRR